VGSGIGWCSSVTLAVRSVDTPSSHLRHPAGERVADQQVRALRWFSLLKKNVAFTTTARTAAVVMLRNRAVLEYGSN